MGIQYQQLTLKERYQIEALNDMGLSARQIAARIKRGNKTVSQELKRCLPRYCAETAHNKAIEIRTGAVKYSKFTDRIKHSIVSLLLLGLSPEQIAGRYAVETKKVRFSCSALYNLVGREGWRSLLARKGKPYKQRQGVEAGAHLIPNRVDISERPTYVDENIEFGHWEGDTVYGQDGYLVTLVERTSKFLLTRRVKRKTKMEVTKAINSLLRPFKKSCKTITFDNGGEFAGHNEVSRHLKCDIYFAKPYHSWQRGLNENTNGLLRRFFPKGMKIGSLPESEIREATLLINARPRKSLNYLSPYEFITNRRVSLIAGI